MNVIIQFLLIFSPLGDRGEQELDEENFTASCFVTSHHQRGAAHWLR